jgi:putative transposase
MPRAARVIVPGCPHHVTQRGNNRQDVFFVDDDRRVFLRWLGEACQTYGVRIDGWCLMTNHIHLVAAPAGPGSLGRAMKRTNQLYAQYVNRLHGRTGHLWQERFFSCPLDEEHYWRALVYVERNPVRARLVRAPWRWAWSSAAAHVGQVKTDPLVDLAAWWVDQTPQAWRDVLAEGLDEEASAALRLCTSRGRPLGSDAWVAKLERRLGRRLRPLPPGRPRRKRGKN